MKQVIVIFAALLIACLVVTGCATDQTKSKVTTARSSSVPATPGLANIDLSAQTVVIDARPTFLFGLEHIPHSLNLQWDDFSQADVNSKGLLQSDLFSITRRLARLGLSPESKVVVVGRGLHGIGEEGRIAWMLQYLGIANVSFVAIETVKGKMLHTDLDQGPNEKKYSDDLTDDEKAERARKAADESTPEVRSAPMWKPVLNESLLATRAELLAVVAHDGVRKPFAFNRHAPVIYRVLDVRSPAEYQARGDTTAKTPNIDAINIEWKEFITVQGRPNLKLKTRLQKVGILTNQRIIVIHDEGVASGEVVLALRAMGYTDAANFAGGWTDLLSLKNDEPSNGSSEAQGTKSAQTHRPSAAPKPPNQPSDTEPINDDDTSDASDWIDD